MAKTPEAKVKEKTVEILKAAGAWYCFPVASGYGRSGIPDILVCWQGQFIAIECKAGDNTPTALQDRELKKIRDAGGCALVVNEHCLEALAKFFRQP